MAFFTSIDHRGYKLCYYQNVCDLLDNIYISLGINSTDKLQILQWVQVQILRLLYPI